MNGFQGQPEGFVIGGCLRFSSLLFVIHTLASGQTPRPPVKSLPPKTAPTKSAPSKQQAIAPSSDYVFEVVAKNGDVIGGKKLTTFHVPDRELGSYPIAINDDGEIAFIACTDGFLQGPGAFAETCDTQSIFTTKRLVAVFPGFGNSSSRLFIGNDGRVAYNGTIEGKPIITTAPKPFWATPFNHKLQSVVSAFNGVFPTEDSGRTFLIDESGAIVSKTPNPTGSCDAMDLTLNERGDYACWCSGIPPNYAPNADNTPIDVCINGAIVGKGVVPQFSRPSPPSDGYRNLRLNNRGMIAYRASGGQIRISGAGVAATLNGTGEFYLSDTGAVLVPGEGAVFFSPDYSKSLKIYWPKGVVGRAGSWAFNNKNQIAVTVYNTIRYVNPDRFVRQEYLLRGTPKNTAPEPKHPCGDPTLPTSYDHSDPKYHHYDSDPATIICNTKESVRCSVNNVFDVLIHTPAAIAPVTTTINPQVVKQCGELDLQTFPASLDGYNNRIKIVIDSSAHSVTNYAMKGHVFYPGQVTRQIVLQKNGNVEINTTGEGTGRFPWINENFGKSVIWPEADSTLRTKARGVLDLL